MPATGYAIGLLLDSAGSDSYEARRYAQGAGTHSTVGALIDSAGNDFYTSWAISQGCGYDSSQGILLDKKGDDTYRAEWFSQGTSGLSGVGYSLDNNGDDSYLCEGFNSQGSGQYSPREESGSIGLLLDAREKTPTLTKGKTIVSGAKAGMEVELMLVHQWGHSPHSRGYRMIIAISIRYELSLPLFHCAKMSAISSTSSCRPSRKN